MAYPFDDEEFQGLGAIPPDLFMQGGQGPSMGGMVPGFSMDAPQEPVMGEESFYQPPDLQGLPDDFFARLAQTQGPSPFNFQPRQGRGARGIDVILAALQGFGNARTAQGAQRTQQVQQENEAAKQGAREMATWRWRQTQEKRLADANKANIAATAARDRATEAYRSGTTSRLEGQGKETARHNRAMEELAATRLGTQAADDENIATWAENVISGRVQLTNAPQRLRSRILQHIADNNQQIIPTKARDTIGALNAAGEILDQVDELSRKLNRGVGAGRVVAGAQNVIGSALQTNPDATLFKSLGDGMLANMARAAGERGVLTDQDIARARKLIPSLTDSREVASGKIQRLRSYFAELNQKAIQTYASSSPSGAQSGSSGAGGGAVVKWGRDPKTGRPVPMP